MIVSPDFVERTRTELRRHVSIQRSGRVRTCVGAAIEGQGIELAVGSRCEIDVPGHAPLGAEVIGFREDGFVLMPLETGVPIPPGARIRGCEASASVATSDAMRGRVLDGLGRPLDGGPPLHPEQVRPLQPPPTAALDRAPIGEALDVGVRSINGLIRVGRGMRMGLFAGSGVGKSTLLGQIARFTQAEVRVIALVGERGREVREFVDRELGDALRDCVVVVSTGDEPALMRVRAAQTATAIAEHFRDQGAHVLLLMDSLTRFCMALREIGLAAGEPPTSRGYPPSAWSALPRLLERAGTHRSGGSITGIYTVLVEGDDPTEPVSDAARSILDGHVILSRELAEAGRFPAIDPLGSTSRVMRAVASPEQQELARQARRLLAAHRRIEDLIAVGAYAPGGDPVADAAVERIDALRQFLSQAPEERASLEQSVEGLRQSLSGVTA